MDYQRRTNPGIRLIRPYVPGRPVQELNREGIRGRVVKMASNENPLGMSPRARRALSRATRGSYQYPESSCPPLRLALADRCRLDPQNIIVGNGADGVIWYLGMCLFAEGDEAVIPEATFPLYATITNAMRARVVSASMNGYRIDLDDVLCRITPHTKAVWLCNPNNPTGTLADRREFKRFYEKLPSSVLLVHDEVYRDFASPQRFPDTLSMIRDGASNLFLLRSFSKLYGMAGLRVGYGIGAEDLVRLLYRTRPPFDVSVPSQAAALGALKGARFAERTLALNERGKSYICGRLKRLGLGFAPSDTNFILLDTGRNSNEVCRFLERRGIIVRPAAKYGYPNHIRITIGRMADNRRFIRALEELLG